MHAAEGGRAFREKACERRRDEDDAELEYDLIAPSPYRLTEADVQFAVHVARLGLSKRDSSARERELREAFFSKPRACFRASPLPKKFGWGVHYDSRGRIAIYAVESDA